MLNSSKHQAPKCIIVAIVVIVILSGLVSSFSPVNADGTPPPARILIQITASSIVIRSGPGESYIALETVNRGGKIELSGISADKQWFMLKYNENQAWIPSDPKMSKFL